MAQRFFTVCMACVASSLIFAAFATTTALGAEWMIAGTPLSKMGGSETVNGKLGAEGGTMEVSELGLQMHCSTVTVQEGVINSGGTGKGAGKLSNCEVVGAEEVCQIAEPISGGGKGSLIEDKENIYVKGQPSEAGKPFTQVTVSGSECPFETHNEPIDGELAVQLGSEEVVEQPGTSMSAEERETLNKDLSINLHLSYGAEPATIKASGVAFLTGANIGKKWGAK